MLLDSLLIYITIPLSALFIRATLEKWGIIDRLQQSKHNVLNNLGYCQLCFYFWADLIPTFGYAYFVNDWYFLFYTPAFTVITLLIHFNLLENE